MILTAGIRSPVHEDIARLRLQKLAGWILLHIGLASIATEVVALVDGRWQPEVSMIGHIAEATHHGTLTGSPRLSMLSRKVGSVVRVRSGRN